MTGGVAGSLLPLRIRAMTRKQVVLCGILLTLTVSEWTGASAEAPASSEQLTIRAGRGDAEAQYHLARALLAGNGVAKDPVRALEWMRKAAAQGHADATGGVGYFFAKGVGIPEDDSEAVSWFRKGADLGSAKAQLNLGLALATGRGVPADEREGLRWIDEAASRKLPDALYAQGETYLWGQFGRKIEYPKALTLFQVVAEMGHPGAQTNLGVMHLNALGTPKDEEAAISWFRKAAAQGYSKAQSNLGHALGLNSPNRVKQIEAISWVMLAARSNEVTAVKSLEELLPNLTPEDLSAAQGLADKFDPAPDSR